MTLERKHYSLVPVHGYSCQSEYTGINTQVLEYQRLTNNFIFYSVIPGKMDKKDIKILASSTSVAMLLEIGRGWQTVRLSRLPKQGWL